MDTESSVRSLRAGRRLPSDPERSGAVHRASAAPPAQPPPPPPPPARWTPCALRAAARRHLAPSSGTCRCQLAHGPTPLQRAVTLALPRPWPGLSDPTIAGHRCRRFTGVSQINGTVTRHNIWDSVAAVAVGSLTCRGPCSCHIQVKLSRTFPAVRTHILLFLARMCMHAEQNTSFA